MNEQLQSIGIDFDFSLTLRLFALVFARLLGLGIPTPFLGGKLIPGRIKFGIPLFLAAFFYPFLKGTVVPAHVPEVGLVYIGLLLKEIFIGYMIGYLVSLPFHGLTSAGSFMDTQRGTTFAQVISPVSGGQSSLIGQFLSLLFLTIFMSVGGLHIVLGAVADSYQVFPLLTVPKVIHPNAPAVQFMIVKSAEVFSIGVQFAAPVVMCMFLTDLTLGIVNRAAPNIRVFFLGMPIKALGGLVIFFIVLDMSHPYFLHLIANLARDVRILLRVMAAT